jgi:hypothetical protein
MTESFFDWHHFIVGGVIGLTWVKISYLRSELDSQKRGYEWAIKSLKDYTVEPLEKQVDRLYNELSLTNRKILMDTALYTEQIKELKEKINKQ